MSRGGARPTVLLCGALQLAERRMRLGLPRLRGALAARAWGAPLEAFGLGVVLGLATACSGSGGEFIYFQF